MASGNLDWSKHDKAITGFVRAATNFYLRVEASTGKPLKEGQGILLRNNYATPARIAKLLAYLSIITSMVRKKINGMSNPPETIANIEKDLVEWEIRLANYYAETGQAIDRNPNASGDEDPVFWDRVTEPLLLGLYPGQDYQSVLDVVTPLTLAWQVEVARDAYVQATDSFWKDLKESASNVLDTSINFGVGLTLLAVAALAFGYGYGRGK